VRDNGVGIAPELLPRIFDQFTQGRQSIERSQGGLGLGLAIVKSLVELHGGRVRAHSDGAGRGSAFTVELPVADAGEIGLSPTPAPPAPPLEPVSGRRVLVVDDNKDAAELIAEMLMVLGYATRVAYDGPSALEVAAEFDPEIALVDIGLPIMDGYELARRLRGDPRFGAIRLIAITGYGQEEDRRRSFEAGFDAHLVKPVPPESLASALG
jgi:CheY-like chemotaxis protein